MYNGVTMNKNILGFVLLICGLCLIWRVSAKWKERGKAGNWLDDIGIPIVLLGMIGWLFQMADSKTSLIGFILAALVFTTLGRQRVRRHVGAYLLAGIAMVVVLQVLFDLKEVMITKAGRDATLSGRTELWESVLQMQQHPALGFGFESFWLGDRLKKLQDMYFFRPTQAHSGYIDMYLNLGWVGLAFFSGVIVSCYVKLREMLTSSSGTTEQLMFGRFGMAFLATFLVYNYTEAAFKSPHFLFMIFLLFAIKPSEPRKHVVQSSLAISPEGAQNIPQGTRVGNMSPVR